MNNVEFSKTNTALLNNHALADVVVSRVMHQTAAEYAAGKIEIALQGGHTLVLTTGTPSPGTPEFAAAQAAKKEKKQKNFFKRALELF